jgi:diguanylate cyclase (GGDEF)-like protein/PAS domain S-box-containing protein
MDMQLTFTYVSPACKLMSGYEADEMVGRCLLDFLGAESRAYIQRQSAQLLQKRADGSFRSPMMYDVEFVCKDKKTIWCQVCVRPVFKDDVFFGLVGTTRDISENKLYENMLKKFLAEQRSKNEQLESLATLDMLTGALNRRKFEYFVWLEIEKWEEYDSTFSIIMFDIDNFKKINDVNGHRKGDVILKDITSLIVGTLRETDRLFRWGGDEFIILLPDLTMKNALVVAEKVRNTIENYTFGLEGLAVTVSLGSGNICRRKPPISLLPVWTTPC